MSDAQQPPDERPHHENRGATVSNALDVIVYSGAINFSGYEALCRALEQKSSDKALLVLSTSGGDPHAAFRIARALQHNYGAFDALVPRYCKSAGTLVLIGASHLYLDDMSELGPLDVQIKTPDEVIGRNSGLDITQALNTLQAQTMHAFRTYLLDLIQGAQLSTRIASEIACNLTSGLFNPISAQVDPTKLAETQRATEIAFAYGTRLAEVGQNIAPDGIVRLVTGYPSHGFVIDRKEARAVFHRVSKPPGNMAALGKAAYDPASLDLAHPNVTLHPVQHTASESKDGSAPQDAGDREGSAMAGEQASHAPSRVDERSPAARASAAARTEATGDAPIERTDREG